MFKRGFPSDSLINNQTATSIPPSPTLNTPFNNQPGFSAFTPEYHQFPYTFSSCTPPTYSWANTNSTNIMKFTGSSNPQPLDTSTYHFNNFGSVPKRKIDLDVDLPHPPKMHITEEKVSASLRDMHISNEFKPYNYCVNSNSNYMDTLENPDLMNIVDTNKTNKTESQTTLVMCEELRKLNKIDSIIPQPFLNVQRPTNAIVLWKPRSVIEFVNSCFNEESDSTVVITEITDEEENEINNQNEMIVEDDCITFEDDKMEL